MYHVERVIRKSTVFVAVSSLMCASVGCRPHYSENDNYEYVRDVLGGVVLASKDKTGHLPKTFDAALSDSGQTLSHRGDLYGGPISYTTRRPDCFFFVAAGPDDETFTLDDLVVVWENGRWFQADRSFVSEEMKRESLEGQSEGREETVSERRTE
ncbi:MAG TPA: hypothetical protein DD670_19195 [Planctomycetaceae bacterium]|nr:hypothetical protein [Planctomycetaceae bacterium]